MEQILSSKTAFFAIFPACIAGIFLRASNLDEFALICFAIGGALLALFILFRRQHIDITDIQCHVSQDTIIGHFHPIEVRGFISARHPVGLLDCKLIVAKHKKEYYVAKGRVQVDEIIDNVVRSFVFHIPLEREDTGELLDWGLVYIKVPGKLLHSPLFQIRTKTHDSREKLGGIVEKLTPRTEQLRDEAEITKQKLHELLDRTVQSVKESEKGKT